MDETPGPEDAAEDAAEDTAKDTAEDAAEDTAPEETAPQIPSRGFLWHGDDLVRLGEVIDAAFDYRGNVTLELRSGERVDGYVSNCDVNAAEPFLELFPSNGEAKKKLLFGEIRGVSFTGKDTASGRSWETWVKKWSANKEAEARGERVGDIGLYPEAID